MAAGGNVKLKIGADSAQAVAALQKVVAGLQKVVGAQEKSIREGRKAAQQTRQGASSAVTSLKQWALGYVGITQAINIARQAFQSMLAERRRGAEELMLRERPLRALAQLATGEADLRKMIAAAKRTAVEEGVTMPEAAAIQFRVVSAGERAQREQYAKLIRISGEPMEAGELAKSAATFKKSFAAEAGTTAQILAKLYAASAVSPARVGEFGPAAARAAAAAQSIKATDEELLATLAIVGTALGTVDEAATATNRLLMSLLKKGITKGLMGGVEALAEMKLSAPELMKFLGKETGFKAYSVIMQNRPEIARLIGTLRAEDVAARRGEPTALGRRLAAPGAIPELAIPEAARKAAQKRKEADIRDGMEQVRRDTAWDVLYRRSKDAGESAFTRFGRGLIWDAQAAFGVSPEYLARQQAGFGRKVALYPGGPSWGLGGADREAASIMDEVGPAAGSSGTAVQDNTQAIRDLTDVMNRRSGFGGDSSDGVED